MSAQKQIKSALISVFYKDGLGPIVDELSKNGVTIYSTGGTQKFIEERGIKVERVEDLTSYPSIFGGRVKTLHPKVFGGILNRRDHEQDTQDKAEYQIPDLDLVIVDLYPFDETVAAGGTHDEIIEKIDIGGISLIRAAAKNFTDVSIVASRDRYAWFLEKYQNGNGALDLEERKDLAKHAFGVSSKYDSSIFQYFAGDSMDALRIAEDDKKTLRYGENPHQNGYFMGNLEDLFNQLNGKELSFNNLLDVDAAVSLIDDFSNEDPTVAVLKHNNACGIASRPTVLEAWKDALAGDPVSAFGGVIVSNCPIDKATAEEINNIFFEVVIAPSYGAGAAEVLSSKKNRIVLERKETEFSKVQVRTALNGFLVQDKDLKSETAESFNCVTTVAPTAAQTEDLVFASKLVKHTKSNAIVLAKNKQLVASGTGQTSRVDALRQAIVKAKAFNFDIEGAVMASDAFFPFPDCVEIGKEAGVAAVVQPGGSIKDQLSVDYCNENGVAMVMTGTRHFKH